ncbi:MAG: hypothetical protein ACOY4R_22370 [Pseudomonadota bacterium]
MKPIIGKSGSTRASKPRAITTTSIFPRRGRLAADSRCISSLRKGYEKQVEQLSAAVPMKIRALGAGSPGMMVIVIGDVLGKTADLSDLPLGTWWAAARSRTDYPVSEQTEYLGFPGYNATSVNSGLYRDSDGELVFGQALIDWNSPYLRGGPRDPAVSCRFNFINGLVDLYVLGIKSRLHDELQRVHIAANRGATEGIGDFRHQTKIRIQLGVVIIASVFCQQVLGVGAPVMTVAGCTSRASARMLAKDFD